MKVKVKVKERGIEIAVNNDGDFFKLLTFFASKKLSMATPLRNFYFFCDEYYYNCYCKHSLT